MPFWITVTRSRALLGRSVALARVARFAPTVAVWWSATRSVSVQVEPAGSMTTDPTSPLLPCLMTSAGLRLVPPNSTGVAMTLKSPPVVAGARLRSPAYQRYTWTFPG